MKKHLSTIVTGLALSIAVVSQFRISNLQSELMAFLNTPDPVLVLNRSAFPLAEAGAGFAYKAPGYELQEAWKVKMTNAVQAAELVPGWIPIFGPETIAELEPILKDRQ